MSEMGYQFGLDPPPPLSPHLCDAVRARFEQARNMN